MKTVLTIILICIGAGVTPSTSVAAKVNPPALTDPRQISERQSILAAERDFVRAIGTGGCVDGAD